MKMKFFYPSQKGINNLNEHQKAQLPFVVNMSLIMFISFFVFSFITFLGHYTYLAYGCFAITALLFLPVFFLKTDKILAASFTISFVLLLAVVAVLMLSPNVDTSLIFFRDAFFVSAMAVVNMLIALHKRQNFIFCLTASLLFILIALTKNSFLWHLPDHHDSTTNLIINIVGIALVVIVIILFSRFNRHLMEDSIKKGEQSSKALDKVTKAFEESREVLNVGQQLKVSVESALSSAQQIQDFQIYLGAESQVLNGQTDTVTQAGKKVSEQAVNMKNSINEQTASISNISSAMTQISANLTSINNIAAKQRESINKTLLSFNDQTNLLHKLVTEVEDVKRSSDEIGKLILTINSVSDQTNLLAMNASIEAAHAGATGKGFAVISQEIRKLSEETRKSSDKITDTLKGNSLMVAETTQSVKDFAAATEKSTQELTATINEIEQILAGISEMDVGTKDVLHSLQSVVEESNTNAQTVQNVAEEINNQEIALNQISGFSASLLNRISELDTLVINIQKAIQNIDNCASNNEEVVTKLSNTFNN